MATDARLPLLADPAVLPWLLLGLGLLVVLLAALWLRQRARGQRLQRRLAANLEASTLQSRLEGEDPLVPGLLSRPRFDALLAKATESADRHQAGLSVLFINLDNFRAVNDGHGYPGGDRVIVEVAKRLLACAGAGAQMAPLVARLGVDEFLLLHKGSLDSARRLASRLCAALGGDYPVADGATATLACSIGLAIYPEHGARAQLVAHASTAMLAVKRAGGGAYMVFQPQMALDLREQTALLTDLRKAQALGQLELYYQPKVDARTLQITAAEALLRWHHPQRGMVSPAVFIPIAERAGLIGAIGQWVIEDACRQAAVWRDGGLRMRVAINLSAYQMRQDDLADRLTDELKRHRLLPSRFTVEITESVAMEDTQVTQRSFKRLRAAGVHVSIDDFGVGQASLSYLRRLPAHELKIDASFVREVDSREDARAIVEAVVRLAHALKLKVVAEGVETPAQRDRLVQLGCDELQGYLFARPMDARALGTWAQLDADGMAADRQFSGLLFQETGPQAEFGPH